MFCVSLYILLISVAMGNGYSEGAQFKSSLESINKKISDLEAKLDSLGHHLINNCYEQNQSLLSRLESKHSSFTSKIIDREELCRSSNFNGSLSSSMMDTNFNRISFNVLQGKRIKASTTHSDQYLPQMVIDEDYATRYSSKEETNPWLLVDLGTTHLIWAIQMSLYQDTRTGPSGIKLYVTDDLTFDNNGVPDMKHSPVFGSIPKDPVNRYVQFTSPIGRCGRYVVIIREIPSHYLTFWEISATGFSLV